MKYARKCEYVSSAKSVPINALVAVEVRLLKQQRL